MWRYHYCFDTWYWMATVCLRISHPTESMKCYKLCNNFVYFTLSMVNQPNRMFDIILAIFERSLRKQWICFCLDFRKKLKNAAKHIFKHSNSKELTKIKQNNWRTWLKLCTDIYCRITLSLCSVSHYRFIAVTILSCLLQKYTVYERDTQRIYLLWRLSHKIICVLVTGHWFFRHFIFIRKKETSTSTFVVDWNEFFGRILSEWSSGSWAGRITEHQTIIANHKKENMFKSTQHQKSKFIMWQRHTKMSPFLMPLECDYTHHVPIIYFALINQSSLSRDSASSTHSLSYFINTFHRIIWHLKT